MQILLSSSEHFKNKTQQSKKDNYNVLFVTDAICLNRQIWVNDFAAQTMRFRHGVDYKLRTRTTKYGPQYI